MARRTQSGNLSTYLLYMVAVLVLVLVIVAGHHHAARAGRMLLRGVPEKLVADARIPVLVVGEREA